METENPCLNEQGQNGPLGLRVAASIIDLILLYSLLFLIQFIPGSNLGLRLDPDLAWINRITGFSSWLLLNGLLLALKGQTIGKYFCNLKIVRPSGAKANFAQCVGRDALLYLVVAIPLVGGWLVLFDYVSVFFNEERRCLHDLVAGTWVVAEDTGKMGLASSLES